LNFVPDFSTENAADPARSTTIFIRTLFFLLELYSNNRLGAHGLS